MNLTFLGLGSAFNPTMDNSNAWFSQGSTFFLIDCGETTFGRIWNNPDYLSSKETAVIVTHLHADHVGSLGSLISYSYYVAGKKIRVCHPLDTVVGLLDLLGIQRRCYEFVRLEEGKAADLGEGLRATPLKVEHVEDMTCFGYILDDGAERIYFSGDAKNIPGEVVAGLASGYIRRIYQDTSAKESDHPTHATISYLEKTIDPALRSRVFCIHLDYDYRALLEEKGFGTLYI
ncbi:MAG: MBL fold metallo-hydrolase [Spirochaetota bacterium]